MGLHETLSQEQPRAAEMAPRLRTFFLGAFVQTPAATPVREGAGTSGLHRDLYMHPYTHTESHAQTHINN